MVFLYKFKNALLLVAGLFLSLHSYSQKIYSTKLSEKQWVDSVYNSLSLEERIGQLFMLRAGSNMDLAELNRLEIAIKKYNIGGVCFFKGNIVKQANQTNYYQSITKTPLLVAMDAEWGIAMRLDSAVAFPRQMTLGAMRDLSLIEKFGEMSGKQLKRMGVHMSFSPVADINNNAQNPVINIRSFGESKYDVATKSILYMKGLQKEGIISVAKHFPGHGDTDVDSHEDLPVINHNKIRLDTLELYPFKQLIAAGIEGIMVGHLHIPTLDNRQGIPSSLSRPIVDSLLRTQMGFKGLVITDALEMKGVANYSKDKVELMALQAENDILLLPRNVESAINSIKQAIDSGEYNISELEIHCKRVLACKYRNKIYEKTYVKTYNLVNEVNSLEAYELSRNLYENAITIIKNNNLLLPLQRLDTLKMASLAFGMDINMDGLVDVMDKYAKVKHFIFSDNINQKDLDSTLLAMRNYNLVIINITNTNFTPAKNYGLTPTQISLVNLLLATKKCVLNVHTLPYAVNLFGNANLAQAIIVSYQDNSTAYEAAASAMFGINKTIAYLPVAVKPYYPIHAGFMMPKLNRLSYDPYKYALDTLTTMRVENLVKEGIVAHAYPGCQVLVAKNGNVMYSKTFGTTDYEHNIPVKYDDLYDYASVTKIASTTLAVMKLYDKKLINLDEPLSTYLPYLQETNKSKITVRQVMTHQAGLVAYIPFFEKTLMPDGSADTAIYHKIKSPDYSLQVADSMFMRNEYKQRIMDIIINSPVNPKKGYEYSDLSMILMQQVVEKITGKPLNIYVDEEFYKPMGLYTLTFKPLEKFPKYKVIPTENDMYFRHQLVQGYVHDQGAAMFGGVAGHAGLFGTANDLAVIMQMLLQKGNYGGVQYIKPETVDLFTSAQYPNNRRGLGFDKRQPNSDGGPTCEAASMQSFGHTGFTGTYAWADPKNNLIFIFLSNRVYPSAATNKLAKMGIRTKVHQLLYKAFNN